MKLMYLKNLFREFHEALGNDMECGEKFEEPQPGPSLAPEPSFKAAQVIEYLEWFMVYQLPVAFWRGWMDSPRH